MKLELVVLLAVMAYFRCDGLSCLPCDETNCKDPATLSCTRGLVKEPCHCCYVCAKDVGEVCGGPWGILGTCGEGLYCKKVPTIDGLSLFNMQGTCEPIPPPTRRQPLSWEWWLCTLTGACDQGDEKVDGCMSQGELYAVGEAVTSHKIGNWCFGLRCTAPGKLESYAAGCL